MSPRTGSYRCAQKRHRLNLCPVTRWFPGRGSAFEAPPARIFYSSKLRAGLGWWQHERASKAVIKCIQHGYRLLFAPSPPPPFRTSPLLVSPADVDFAIADLAKGDSLGAYQPLLPAGRDFLSRTRVDTQPGGKRRVVHNYRRINDCSLKSSCRYEGVKDLPSLLRPGDFLLSCDCRNAFWSVPLHRATAHYLSFHFALPAQVREVDGSLRPVPLQPGGYWVTEGPTTYQVVERSCAALPFGYTNSPFVWTKLVKVLARAMRVRGIRCLWFIDDALIAMPSRAEAVVARDLIEELFLLSGLTRAPDKGQWEPSQCLHDHLGFVISTASAHGRISVPARRCRDIAACAKDLLCRSARSQRLVPSDLLRSFLGKVSSISAACDQARLRLRSLHDVSELWLPSSRLDRAALRDLQWWSAFTVDSKSNGVMLWPPLITRAIYTNASSTLGYGAVSSAPQTGRKAFGGWWQGSELDWHITMKELVAVRKGILAFADDLRGRSVRLWEDNMAVVFIIKNRTSSSPLLMAELRVLLALLEDLDIRLVPRYIKSELNPADEFSRLTDRDAWSLRPHVQRMLSKRALAMLHCPAFSLDAFACHQTTICPRYASRLFNPAALAFDGLALDWHKEQAVWINPPWALLPDIIGKLACERPAAVLIVPHWPTQPWWPSLLALGGTPIPLPLPKFSVTAMHRRLVEPFLHQGLQLLAVTFKRGTPR